MKQAKISKVLALVLACVMVFTTLPLFAFAADESETYTVSYGAPAILMNKNTKVNLADISVEMDAEGTTVSGADITWAAEAQDGIVFNAAAKTVTAMAKGVYKLTATSSDVTKNVWVMVKEEEEDKFYLVNLPQLNKDTFVADDWRIFGSINNTDVTVSDALTNGIITLTNDYVQISHKYSETDSSLKKGSTIVYVHEIFKDFADYTVEASVSSNSATTVTDTGAGVGGRITLNEKETGFTTGILSYIRQTKVPAITRTNNEYGPHGTAVTTTPYTTWTGYSAYHTVKTIYDGNHFTYYYDTDMLYEYTSTPPSCTCTNVNCIFRNTIPGAGYPAVVGFGATARIASFAVYLNNNELAPATEVNYYTVKYATPAIPMDVDTAVNLDFINVEMDAEGTLAMGNQILWAADNQDGLYLNEEANRVSVYKAGIYKLTATAGGKTKNVWIIAKEAEEEKFYLVNMPEFNASVFNTDDWRVMGSMNNTDISVSDAIEAGIITFGDSYVEVSHKFSETDSALKKGGILVYADPMLKEFADYTVEASASSGGAATVEGVGAGVGGRVTLNEKETGYTTGILSYIRQSKVATITRINNDFGPHGTAIAKDEAGKWYTWAGLSDYHTLKNVYDGNVFSFYYDDGEPIYTYNSTPGTCTCTNANCVFKHTIPGAGYPALVGFGATARFSSFSVYLNSTEMPDAIAAEEIPEPEEPAIYEVEAFDPVIVMYNNTEAALNNITVQFENDGEAYPATDVTWTVSANDGIKITNGAEGKITAYNNGTYIVTATKDDVSKKIYVIVTDKSKSEIVLFTDDFSNQTLDYSVWQQTEYYWDEAYQVTEQKPYKDKYTEGINIAQLGAIPFVTRDYWDALTLGGPRSHSDAGGTGYDSSKIFMNNVQYYAYLREDFITEDGIRLSDLGVYDVSMNFDLLNSGTNISVYKAASDTFGGVKMETNGIGVMGRIDFAGESYYKKGSSTMQSFMFDASNTTTRQLIIGAGSTNKTNVAAGAGALNTFGIASFNVKYRPDKVAGTYIPHRVEGAANYGTPSYSFSAETSNNIGTVGFFTEGRDIDIFDFTVTYPVNVPEYTNIEITAEDNTVTVPVNTTIDLSKYTFSLNGENVKGNEVAWSGLRNSVGEIDAVNGTFTAFSVGTASVDGVTFIVSDNSDTLGTNSLVKVSGNGTVTVSPNQSSNSYTAKVTANAGQLLKAGVITVNYSDGTQKIVPVDENGNAEFTADNIGGVWVSANFVEKQELGFVSLGATIRLPGTKDGAGNTLKHGIRFGARLNNVRLNGDKALLDSEITIDGKDYKVAELGSLIIPTRLLNGAALTVDSAHAQKKRVTMASNTTEDYADITAVLVGIPETWYDLDISFRGYIKYTELDGTGEYYVYTDEISRSYNGVMKAAPVYDTGAYFDVNNTTVMLTASKANIKYGLGEQMTVFADTYIGGTMANGVKLTYNIYAGDADGYSGAALAVGTAYSAGNASVKISYTPENAGYYYVVVSAFDVDDNMVITDTIRLGSGIVSENGTNTFDENNIAINFGVTSDTHVRGEYSGSTFNKHFADLLRVINNQAGYYADGTQKLDALLIAGDLTNAVTGNTNLSGLPKDTAATTAAEFDYLIYSETKFLRDTINSGLGNAQLLYSLGNHDTTGGGRASFIHESYTFRSTYFYQQMFSGKYVELPDPSALEKGYDKSLLFEGMSEEEIQKLHFNRNDDYTDSKDYVKNYARDEESSQEFAYGNRVMKINGITFIALQNTILQNGYARYTDATIKFLKNALDESVANDPSAPVFIITHYRPYGTHGFHVDPVDAGAVNIDEILKDYPQAFIWGGHEHDTLLSETGIVQTRVVDQKGRVIESGYTSITSAVSAYTSPDVFDFGSQQFSSFVQLVQVDVNGNVRVTKYLVDSPLSGQGSTTTQGDEIVMGEDGQWIKSWSDNSSEVVTRVKTINRPWYITNAMDDSVRDEYAVDTRAALSKPEFTSDDVTVDGNTITFPKAVNALGINNENTVIYTYRARLYDASGNLVETKVVSPGPQRYANYYDVPQKDTYSVTFTGTGTKVVITAYDDWAAYLDHSKYPTLTIDLATGDVSGGT